MFKVFTYKSDYILTAYLRNGILLLSIIELFTMSNLSEYSTTSPVPTSINSSGYAFLFIIIAIFLIMRTYRGISGRRFNTSRVYRTPIIYGILLVFFVVYLEYSNPLFFLTLLFVPVGFLIGLRFDIRPKFFYNNQQLYYKRNPLVLIIWLISYLSRLALEFLYPSNIYANITVDSLLALTTGIIISEAITLLKTYKIFVKESPKPNQEGRDSFQDE